MLVRWYDINREMAELDELHRRVDRYFGDLWDSPRKQTKLAGLSRSWPAANLYDTGSSLTAFIQVPGLAEGDLKVEIHDEVLSVSGLRKTEAPEGYYVHRSERGSRRFSRSFGLPCRVDSEKSKAVLKDGILTIKMEKHAEAQPKQITVSVS